MRLWVLRMKKIVEVEKAIVEDQDEVMVVKEGLWVLERRLL